MTSVNADGTALCPLCRRLAYVTREGVLHHHFSREVSMVRHRSLPCRASRLTLAGAQALAEREEDELEALRMRAHP